jgi:hypothetical protein
MNYNQKMLLGVAVVGVAGYYYWKSQQKTAKFIGTDGSLFDGRPDSPIFAGMAGMAGYANFKDEACRCHTGSDTIKGKTYYKCGDGVSLSDASEGPCKKKKQQN